ncbi:hypothetical protein AB5J49_25520 [Streptomyces sp. R28]|uniref:Uncharacterized protein n=1 Tax=Streptomyces sp. R28 TaxID=3238628 RepID=A0AB39Q297_9ACTN
MLVLAMLRRDQRLLDLVGGNGVPESALRRWRDEMVDLLADLGLLGMNKPDDSDDLVIGTGYKATRAHKLTPGRMQANRILAASRAPSNTDSQT